MRRPPRVIPATVQDVQELDKRSFTGQQKWLQEVEKWESVFLNPKRTIDHEEAKSRLAAYGFCYQIRPVDKETMQVEIKSARKGKTLKEFHAHPMNAMILRKLIESYPTRSIEVENKERIRKIMIPYDGIGQTPIHLIETMPTISHLETIAFMFPERDRVKLEGITEADLSGRYGRAHDERPQVNLYVHSSDVVSYQAEQPNGHVAAAGHTRRLETLGTLAYILRKHSDLRAQIAGPNLETSDKLKIILRHELQVKPTVDEVYGRTA